MIINLVLIALIIALVLLWYLEKKKAKYSDGELRFLKKEKEYYPEAIFILSKKYEIIYANKSARELLDLIFKNNKYTSIGAIRYRSEDEGLKDLFSVIEKKNNTNQGSHTFKNVELLVSEESHRVDIHVDKNIWNINQTITCVIHIHNKRKTDIDISKQDGSIDFLTGMSNQFAALSDINILAVESKKESRGFGLVLMGIDYYDELIYSMGHSYSNQLIKSIGQSFQENVQDNTKVYRMDCNVFLCIVKNTRVDMETLAKDLVKKVKNDSKRYKDIRLSVSIGITRYPEDGENSNKLIDNAYIALAHKKSILDIKTKDSYKNQIRMNEDIRKGLVNNEFELYYQPILSLKEKQIIGAEALIRWSHPKHGLLNPDKFLSIAEKTGLVVDIGEYVFSKAIQQGLYWNKLGFRDLQISVNLSLREMQVEEFVEKIEFLFEKYSTNPQNFNLDVTEKAAMANIDNTIREFRLFDKLGLSISLDQFGASHSSLKDLQALPLTMIKIDKSLILNLEDKKECQKIVKTMIDMAHTFGYKVVAEGVETQETSNMLLELSCDYAQGYFYSRPVPVDEFELLFEVTLG